MRLGLLFAASLLSVSLFGSRASALPHLEKPAAASYGYQFAAPDAEFDTLRHGKTTWWRQGLYDYYLFEPRFPNGTAPESAPVIVYIHGADAAPNPANVREQVAHYVQSGFTVIWPVFCGSWPCIDYDDQENGAITAIHAAFGVLESNGHVHAARDAAQKPRVAFVAHSVGTVMAARIAARFGREQVANPRVPAPQVLVFHDPAGYEQKVDWANVDIRRSFPLEGTALSGMRADTQLLMLIAEGSVGDPNSLSTVPRLWGYVPAIRRKKAYIVPHQCVKRVDGVDDYSCPTGNFDPNSTSDIHTENQHLYYSLHDAGKSGATPVGWRGLFDPTVDCIREAFSGQVQPHCSGALATDMGEWLEDGVVVSPTRPRLDYTPGPFTP